MYFITARRLDWFKMDSITVCFVLENIVLNEYMHVTIAVKQQTINLIQFIGNAVTLKINHQFQDFIYWF